MDSDDDSDSLFGSESTHNDCDDQPIELPDGTPIASRLAPSIPGMFFFPELLSRQLHDQTLQQVSACGYFDLDDETGAASNNKDGQHIASPQQPYNRSPRNQAMLFARSLHPSSDTAHNDHRGRSTSNQSVQGLRGCSGLPTWAVELIRRLEELLTSLPDHQLPRHAKDLIFPADQLLSRQLILNLYTGAEGLASHVDLVNRFADGILLCSFGPQGTGIVMDFTNASLPPHHLFLPAGSILLLSGEARYSWKHGISARSVDLVRSATCPEQLDILQRSIRLSITIRSMLPGADVVDE